MKLRQSLRRQLRAAFGVLCALILLQGLSSTVIGLRVGEEIELMDRRSRVASSATDILSGHTAWLSGFALSAYLGTDYTPGPDADSCSLGVWLESEDVRDLRDETLLQLIQQVQAPHRALHEDCASLIERTDGSLVSPDMIRVEYEQVIAPNAQVTIGLLEEISSQARSLTETSQARIHQMMRISMIITVGVSLACTALAVVWAAVLIRRILPPLEKLTGGAEMLAAGHTDLDLRVDSRDEIGKLAAAFQKIQESERRQTDLVRAVADGDLTRAVLPRSQQDLMSHALNRMVDSVGRMFREIRGTARQVEAASSQLADGAQVLAEGATEQNAAVEELSCTIEQVAEQSEQNAAIAERAALLGENINNLALRGAVRVEELTGAVRDIHEAGTAIQTVIKAIDEIAFKTNILALNAAVEAARAGQHGRGFAVVAGEVRSLAQKSAESARETGVLIGDTIEKVDLGTRIAGETAAALEQILHGIGESSEIVSDIAHSSRRQASDIRQLSVSIDQVAQVVHQNSATAEESASASEELSAQAMVLSGMLSRFRLQDDARPEPPPPQGGERLLQEFTGFSLTGDPPDKYR